LNKIRLAYLVSQYPTITHTFILREIRSLRDRGFDIDVISIRPADRPFDQLSEVELDEARQTFVVVGAGFGVIAVSHAATFITRPLAYLRGLMFALRLARWRLRTGALHLAYFAEAVVVGRYMLRRGLGHLHTHFSSTVALLLARVFPVSFSATIHGPDEFSDPAGFFLREKVEAAKFICAISEYGASQLRKAAPERGDRIEVNRLGVDSGVFVPRPHREAVDRIELLSVGRLAAAKGYPVLLGAVARLAESRRGSFGLRIVGEGAMRGELERIIAERGLEEIVALEGACGQEQLRALYSETEVFVLASFAEGIPVVLMEAMAMEIPCIATRITGIPELIEHGRSGWLVPPGDEQALADAIVGLAGDGALRERLGKAARIRIQAQYELSHNVEALAAVFRRRLSGGETLLRGEVAGDGLQ